LVALNSCYILYIYKSMCSTIKNRTNPSAVLCVESVN